MDNKLNQMSGSVTNRNVGPTYRATIRTPMNTTSAGMNESLTAMEGDEHLEGKVANLPGRARQMAGDAIGRMHDIKESLVSRASGLREEIADFTGTAKDKIVNRTNKMADQVRNYDYAHVVDEGRTILRNDPTRTIVIAGGIGLAIGFLLGRRHD